MTRLEETSTKARPRDRRATILRSAAELFAENGFSGVSVENIGKQVGVSGPAIYKHFKSKEALLDAIMIDLCTLLADRLEAAMRTAMVTDLDSTVAVRSVSDVHFATLMEYGPESVVVRRERSRWMTSEFNVLPDLDRRIMGCWEQSLLAARPSLDVTQLVMRSYGVSEASIEIAAERGWAAMPDHALELVSNSCVAALLATPDMQRRTEIRFPAWHPTRRDPVVEIALARFRTNGFHRTSIDDITAAAGISTSAFYRRYQSKSDILVDAYDRLEAYVERSIDSAIEQAATARDALTKLVQSFAETCCAHRDLIAVAINEESALPAEERPRLRRRRRASRDIWATVLMEARSELSENDALMLVSGVIPLMMGAVISVPPGDVLPYDIAPVATSFLLGDSG